MQAAWRHLHVKENNNTYAQGGMTKQDEQIGASARLKKVGWLLYTTTLETPGEEQVDFVTATVVVLNRAG